MKQTIFLFFILFVGLSANAQPTIKWPSSTQKGKTVDYGVAAKKLRVVIVADRSSSMSGTKISDLNRAMNFFFDLVKQDNLRQQKVEVAVVSFNDSERLERNPSTISSGENAPNLQASGGTTMAQALATAEQLCSQASGIKPVVVLISDGLPSDKQQSVAQAQALQGISTFYALGVDGADMSFLQQLAGSNAHPLKGTNFNDFFQAASFGITSALKESATQPIPFGGGNLNIPVNIPSRGYNWREY